MTQFRPCIDIHNGKVKQIVGSSLESRTQSLKTNYVSPHDTSYFASLYKKDRLTGGHVIKLGPGNEQAAMNALAAWPGGLQLGGGITIDNAEHWLALGAEKVIVTSWLFTDHALDMSKVVALSEKIGADKLVIDLSCRKQGDRWFVATDRWQTITDTEINRKLLQNLSTYCAEYLIHAADVEGKCEGIDLELVTLLGAECPIPCTYAGGAKCLGDLDTVHRLSNGNVDLTFGSALDLFGGELVKYEDCVRWNREHQ
ncbi:MAG: phosphoribosylformimino-5-aminoimidazole carboxamide ribotide isomerase [Deltaproteobacteria bacterium]|nr:phosphoribosylformimino-5-aminoimidazole carboxamide ribotide isomerase [Deltaproteobacteria bacterium]MBN2671586.1 phosphoribosylformimino-5-aminoimidazole carboxamide ribotide isomerase [Deltaproteobacteria bacterium]